LNTEAKPMKISGIRSSGGVFNLAHSALDMALWDIRGKALNLPLHATPAVASSRSAISAIC
jgi:L-alanine-DL-glutamate epimerase-like enolase superfamily enzyme